jgi:inosine-uridine nucleoside N-ribohydrolase
MSIELRQTTTAKVAFALKCIVVFILFGSIGSKSVFGQNRPQLILDADTANEIDDMFAITRMLNQEKFEVLALTSTQWIHYLGEQDSVGGSQRENEALVKLLDANELPTPIGSKEPMGKPWGGDEAKDSPAAQFIINAAKAARPENKLIVVCLGASTNLASAIKLEPSIANNIDAYLLGFRYDHEKQVWNKSSFNIRRDLNAADYVLNCEALNLHVMPANVARPLTFARDETFKRHDEMGELGAHLTAKWKARFEDFDTWVMWDLALVEAILHPELATMKQRSTPPENVSRKVWVYDSIDVQLMRDDYWQTVLPKEDVEPRGNDQ